VERIAPTLHRPSGYGCKKTTAMAKKGNYCGDAVVATTPAPSAGATATTTTHGVVVQEATDAFGLRVAAPSFYFISCALFLFYHK